MATRSRIGYELSDGSILSIYCHYDGYPEFNGAKLQEHFNTAEKVQELIDLGDISCLWTNAGWNNETLPETGPLPYQVVAKTARLDLIRILWNTCFLMVAKSITISLRMVSGCAMICTSLTTPNFLKSLRFLLLLLLIPQNPL